MEANKGMSRAKFLSIFLWIFKKIAGLRKSLNSQMEGKYSASLFALFAAAASGLLILIMLFFPNYVGVADDGSYGKFMNAAGVYYLDGADDVYTDYFIKTYTNIAPVYHEEERILNSQVLLIRMAVMLDDLITGDRLFDIRFLALIYGILYVPAVYLLIRQACTRTKSFAEGMVLAIVGVLIFVDVAYVSYFNSFYPEALWMISLMYCAGAMLSFQDSVMGRKDYVILLIYVIAVIFFISSRRECAFIGILLSIYCLKLMFIGKTWAWSVTCGFFGILLSVATVGCLILIPSDYDESNKFHAMTRGVLFQASDPEKTLASFGIPGSYELLADASEYDSLPLVYAGNEVLQEEFLSRYGTGDIMLYYIKNPGHFFAMVDAAIKSCFGIRREYCGNYEKESGHQPRAKSLFWSGWSTFKNNMAPKTIGFLLILCGAVFLLYGKDYSLRASLNRKNTVFADMMVIMILLCFLQSGVTIINSGDAEMVKNCFAVSLSMDIITYFIFAEIIHKLKVF